MITLQVEHNVPSFEGWKKSFDSDLLNREKSGVRRYSIFRQANDPNYVIINLEFDSLNEAEILLASLQSLWGEIEGKIIVNPQTRILNMVETIEYNGRGKHKLNETESPVSRRLS